MATGVLGLPYQGGAAAFTPEKLVSNWKTMSNKKVGMKARGICRFKLQI